MKKSGILPALIVAAGIGMSPGVAGAQTQDELNLMQQFLGIMTDYFEIIEATHAVSADPEMAAIMHMQKIQEVYEERGEKARAIETFREVLKSSNNPTIRNAAFFMLGDALKETGRADEAVKLLQEGLQENVRNAQ